MSSALFGCADLGVGIITSVAALGGAAVASTCACSAAAIGTVIGLPLYGTYKAGDLAYTLCSQIVSTRHSINEEENRKRENAHAEQIQLIRKIERLESMVQSEPDLKNLLSSLKARMRDKSEHIESSILFSANQTCRTLLDAVQPELLRREKYSSDSRNETYRINEFRKRLQSFNILPVEFSYSEVISDDEIDTAIIYNAIKTLAGTAATKRIKERANQLLSDWDVIEAKTLIFENAITKFDSEEREQKKNVLYDVYRKLAKYTSTAPDSIEAFTLESLQHQIEGLSAQAEEKINHTIKFATLLRDAEEKINDKKEALSVAKQSYIKIAFETEMKNLHIISNEPSQEKQTLEGEKQSVRSYKSGLQMLRETTTSDGTTTLELITPNNFNPAIVKSLQHQRCEQFEALRKSLKKKWDIDWNPVVISDENHLLFEEVFQDNATASYFNTACNVTKKKKEKNITLYNHQEE